LRRVCLSVALAWLVASSAFADDANQPSSDGDGTYYPGTTEADTRAGHGEISLTVQYGHFNKGTSGYKVVNVGQIDARALFLQVDYNITDRLSVSAAIPYFSNRYIGGSPHDIHEVDPDHGEIDDGHFHGDWQDFLFGANYLLVDEEFKLEPFTLITIPSHHYPTFSHAAVGRRLTKVLLGTKVSYFPAFDDWYVTASIGRVFSEKPLGHSVDHWKFTLEPGYYLAPDFAVHGYAEIKQGNGLSIPRDFPSQHDEKFFQHDRLLRENYIDVGGGFDWLLPGGRRISGLVVQMIRAEDAHILRLGVQLTFAQSF
jgi:hypothetical protein